VLITRNDAVVGLYNGDIGIALAEPDGTLRVWFDGGGTGPRAFAPSQLPPHETAFAMTIHKSQGSEFVSVAVVLPPAPSAILSRELLYTGLTRARSQVLLVGSRASIETAIRHPSARGSGLRDRIRAALRDASGTIPSSSVAKEDGDGG
jgi:exodeoxyribonuclease V alpha subunit